MSNEPKTRRLTAISFALAIALSFGGDAAFGQGMMDNWGRGASPQERRNYLARIERSETLRAQSEVSARRYNTSARTLRAAIAGYLAVNPRTSDAELLRLLEEAGKAAARVETIFTSEAERNAAITDNERRRRADQALAAARTAFEAGDFEEARRQMAAGRTASRERLQSRREQYEVSLADWIRNVEGEAQIAFLQGDFEGTAAIYLSALAEEPSLSDGVKSRFRLGAAVSFFQRGAVSGDNAALRRSIELAEESTSTEPAEDGRQYVVHADFIRAGALSILGHRLQGTRELAEALAAYDRISPHYPQTGNSRDWITLQINIAIVKAELGRRDTDKTRLTEARDILERVLPIAVNSSEADLSRSARYNLAVVLTSIADAQSLHRASQLLIEAIADERAPLGRIEKANIQISLSSTYYLLFFIERRRELLSQAIGILETALSTVSETSEPHVWAIIHSNLGNSLREAGAHDRDVALLNRSIFSFRATLRHLRPDNDPSGHADFQHHLGHTLNTLYLITQDPATLAQVATAFEASLATTNLEANPVQWAKSTLGLAYARGRQGYLANNPAAIQAALRQATTTAVYAMADSWLRFYYNKVQSDLRLLLRDLAN